MSISSASDVSDASDPSDSSASGGGKDGKGEKERKGKEGDERKKVKKAKEEKAEEGKKGKRGKGSASSSGRASSGGVGGKAVEIAPPADVVIEGHADDADRSAEHSGKSSGGRFAGRWVGRLAGRFTSGGQTFSFNIGRHAFWRGSAFWRPHGSWAVLIVALPVGAAAAFGLWRFAGTTIDAPPWQETAQAPESMKAPDEAGLAAPSGASAAREEAKRFDSGDSGAAPAAESDTGKGVDSQNAAGVAPEPSDSAAAVNAELARLNGELKAVRQAFFRSELLRALAEGRPFAILLKQDALSSSPLDVSLRIRAFADVGVPDISALTIAFDDLARLGADRRAAAAPPSGPASEPNPPTSWIDALWRELDRFVEIEKIADDGSSPSAWMERVRIALAQGDLDAALDAVPADARSTRLNAWRDEAEARRQIGVLIANHPAGGDLWR